MAIRLSSATLSQGARIALVAGLIILVAGAGLYAYRLLAQPVTLKVAAGSLDGEAVQLMSAIASRLASTNSQIRLKIVDSRNIIEASQALSAGKTDLAIVRGDVGDLSGARTVVRLTYGVVMIIAPPGSAVDSIDKLKDKTVGVVGGEINQGIVAALTREYDLAHIKVRFKPLALADVPPALQSKQVHAVLVVTPISEKYLALVRGLFPRQLKQAPGLIPIESADAIAAVARAYESYELPKATLHGSPPVPDEDLSSLRVPFYLVADKKLANDQMTTLAKAIMEVRRDLIAAYPLLAQISAPDTDKDAFIPIHPGAAAYFSGDEKTVFDKYGDQFFYGSMLLGTVTSLLAGVWRFMKSTPESPSPIRPLYALADRIRKARNETDLTSVEDEIDAILEAELAKHGDGDSEAADAAVLGLTAHRLEYLLNRRRTALREASVTSVAV